MVCLFLFIVYKINQYKINLDLRSKEVLTRQQLNAMEQNKPSTVNIQTKIEERHRQVFFLKYFV
jgi:hypothetical protein